MLLLPSSSRRLSQPQERPLELNRQNALGAVLDAVWLGNDLSGTSVGLKIVATPPSSAVKKSGIYGVALDSNGSNTSMVPVPSWSGFPFIQIGFGYAKDGADYWWLSGLEQDTGYTYSYIQTAGDSIIKSRQFIYPVTGGLLLNVPSGLSSGRPVCAIIQVFSPSDYRLYADGLQVNSVSAMGTSPVVNRVYPPAHHLNGGLYFSGYGFGRALTDAQALQITSNPDLLWDAFQPATRTIFIPTGSGSAALVGVASAVESASGSLSTSIRITGALLGVSTASGMLTSAIPLAGIAASLATSSGTLSATFQLSGAALAQAISTANVTSQIRLSGASVAAALATGALSTPGALAGSAVGLASATGNVTAQITLSGASVAAALATGNLLTPGALAGSAVGKASATGAVMTAIRLEGNASARALSSGGLSTSILISGAVAAVATANGNLTVTFGMSGAAVARAIAIGALSVQIRLAGAAVSGALSTAQLTTPTASLGGSAIASATMAGTLAGSTIDDPFLDVLYEVHPDSGMAVYAQVDAGPFFPAYFQESDDRHFSIAQASSHSLRYRCGVTLAIGSLIYVDGKHFIVTDPPMQINAREMHADLAKAA